MLNSNEINLIEDYMEKEIFPKLTAIPDIQHAKKFPTVESVLEVSGAAFALIKNCEPFKNIENFETKKKEIKDVIYKKLDSYLLLLRRSDPAKLKGYALVQNTKPEKSEVSNPKLPLSKTSVSSSLNSIFTLYYNHNVRQRDEVDAFILETFKDIQIPDDNYKNEVINQNKQSDSLLLSAIANGKDLNTIQAIVKKDNTVVIDTDDDDNNPFHLAALQGNIELLKYLLQKGSGLHAKNKHKFQPTHMAVIGGNQQALKLLLIHGASCEPINWDAVKYTWHMRKQ